MVRRRKIGAAYAKSPAKRISGWISQHLLIFASAAIVALIFWFAADWFIDSMLNFLVTGGDESVEKPLSSNDDVMIAGKLLGVLILTIVVAKSQMK